MPSHRTQRTKRSKTFTGCWTCRNRKIKCDEAEPGCQQCRRSGLTCEGYSTRLQWLTPSVPHAYRDEPDLAATAGQGPPSSLRRVLPAEPCRPVLHPRELERILKFIDAVDTDLLPEGEVSFNVNNFSVLRCAPLERLPETQNSSPSPTDSAQNRAVGACSIATELRAASPECPDITSIPLPREGVSSHTIIDMQTADAGTADDSPTGGKNRSESTDIRNARSPTPLMPCEAENEDLGCLNSNPTTGSSSFFDWRQPHDIPANDLSLYPKPALNQFLMRHYAERVCRLFCAMDTPKSPWKTIHLPRALEAMGELSVTGRTSRVRNALLHTLLSISAWYMSNDHQRHNANDQADRWAEAAARYGFDAISLLKQAVDADLYCEPRPKYKDFLATMLSMITVNVMSGNTSTCGVHLNGAHQLLVQMWDKKKRASEKTKTLHRIYCYLRIIWESTQLFEDGGAEFDLRSVPHGSVFKMLEHCDLAGPAYSTLPGSFNGTPTMSSFEYIYGIPQSLLAMLEDTIKLIHRLDRAKKGIEAFEDADAVCNQLEQRILDWSMAVPQGSDSPASDSAQEEVFQHQSTSFHSALVIYFSQNVRLLDRRYLKQYVEDVLNSIHTIELIKAETNMLAAPLFWPAFIAATTAYTSEHQARFRKWYEEANSYGIATVRTGICVVLEVWAKGPPLIDSRACPWRHVVSGNSDNLMLS